MSSGPKLSLVTCPDCGGVRTDAPGAHSPRFVVRQGRYVLVDCQLRPLAVPLEKGVGP